MRIAMLAIVFCLGFAGSARAETPPTAYSCSPGTPKIRVGCNCPTGFAAKRDADNVAVCQFVRKPKKPKADESPDVKACANGDATMCFELSERYYEGTDGATKDPKKAMGFLEKACNLNQSFACNNLGTNWSDGKDGAPNVDHAKAAGLYKKACSLGNGLGCFNYGNVFRLGEGVEVDKFAALTNFKKSCELGEAKGCTEEAIMYYEGDPVRRDIDKAKKLFERSCELGSKVGCKNLQLLTK
jgi:TPR repeat protein